MIKVVTFFETRCRFDFWEFGKIQGHGKGRSVGSADS